MDNVVMLRHRYPNLFAVKHWRAAVGSVDQTFSLCDMSPSDNLIGNVNIAPFVGETCLVIRLSNGQWEIPGGTREPGEPYIETAKRELLEEAGARLLTFTLFGAWHCRSTAPEPYRAHLPHPEFYRVVGWGEVKVVGQPLDLAGAEEVALVECVPVEEAARRFRESSRPDLAELYMLAAELRAASVIEGRANGEFTRERQDRACHRRVGWDRVRACTAFRAGQIQPCAGGAWRKQVSQHQS